MTRDDPRSVEARLGLIHCDLKPENILIQSYSRCEVKVVATTPLAQPRDTLGGKGHPRLLSCALGR